MGQGNKKMVQDNKNIYGWSQIIASMPIMDDPSLVRACLFTDMGPNWAQAGPNLGPGPNRAQTGPGTRDKPSKSKPARPSQPRQPARSARQLGRRSATDCMMD